MQKSKIRARSKIRTARKNKGWTQDELAEKLGVTVKTVGRLERGEYKPNVTMIIRLSRLFKCRPTDLL